MMRDNGIPALTASYPASFLRQGDGNCCTLSARWRKFEVLICLLLAKAWPGCFRGYHVCGRSVYGVPAHLMGKGLKPECLSALGPSPSGSTSLLQGMSPNHSFQSPPAVSFLYTMFYHSRKFSCHTRLALWSYILWGSKTPFLVFTSGFLEPLMPKQSAQQWLLVLLSPLTLWLSAKWIYDVRARGNRGSI